MIDRSACCGKVQRWPEDGWLWNDLRSGGPDFGDHEDSSKREAREQQGVLGARVFSTLR